MEGEELTHLESEVIIAVISVINDMRVEFILNITGETKYDKVRQRDSGIPCAS